MQPMTEKQIKRLRNAVKHYFWVKYFIFFMALFLLWASGMKIYYAWCVGQKLDIPLSHFITMFEPSDMARSYSGAEVFAGGLICGCVVHFMGALWMFLLWTILHPMHKQNKLLLYYIDKEQSQQ